MQTAGFQTFAAPHLITLGLTLVLPILLAVIARRAASGLVAASMGYLLAIALLINEVIYWGLQLAEFGLSRFLRYDLPLHVCGIALFATAVTLLFPNQRTYEIAYFWGLVGCLNAVITPGGLQEVDFPEYRFFQYFITHSGIVVGSLFATWGLGMRPTLGGLVRAFVCLNVLAGGVALVNTGLGSNYMYLSEPPSGTVSPFFFARWPWYIPILELIGLAMFFAAFSPFLVVNWWSSRRSADHRQGTGASGFSSAGADLASRRD